MIERCPGCGHLTANHGPRGCYAGACKCPRSTTELGTVPDDFEVVVPLLPELLPVRAQLEASAERIRAQAAKMGRR